MRRNRPAAAILILAAAVAAPPARAQLLDLGAAPSAPAAGTGQATSTLAAEILREADHLATAEPVTHLKRVRAAARILISRLLSTGEAMGQPGSPRILLAHTLRRALPAIDRIADSASGPTAEADLALIAHDLAAAAAALRDRDVDIHKITRDGLAGLLQLGPPAGQPDSAPLAPALEAWKETAGLTPEAAEALIRLDASLGVAQDWAAYAPAADRTRDLVRAAAAAASTDALWVPPAGRAALGQAFSAAAVELESTGATAGLLRLARLGPILRRMDSLDAGNPASRVRAALLDLIAAPDPATEPQRLAAFERALDLVLAQPRDEKDLVRVCRIPLRSVSAVARQTAPKLLAVLPDILARGDAMTDPAVLSAVAAHRQAAGDWAMLARLSDALAVQGIDAPSRPGTPGPAPRWVRIADRVFALGQLSARAEARDQALADLRILAGQIDRFLEFPGEAGLRAGSPLWDLLTGGRRSELLSEISDRRGGWADGWDKQGYAGSPGDVQRLTALLSLMQVLHDIAPVVESIDPRAAAPGRDPYAALQASPAWELAPESLAELCRGMTDRAAEAVRLITAGDAAATGAAADRIRRDFAVAVLAGRLARAAEPAAGASPVSALPETITPVPGPLATLAPGLADICRYGEEAAVAWRSKPSQDRAEALTRFINHRASELLDSVSPAGQP